MEKHQLCINFNFVKKKNLEKIIEECPRFIKKITIDFDKYSKIEDNFIKAILNNKNSSIFYSGVEEKIKKDYFIQNEKVKEFIQNNYTSTLFLLYFCKMRINEKTNKRIIGIVAIGPFIKNNIVKDKVSINNHKDWFICLYFPIEYRDVKI